MNSTNKTASGWRRTLLGVAAIGLTTTVLAQSPAAESNTALLARITAIQELLATLDEQASTCLNTPPNGELDNPACKALLEAIDGEPIAAYLRDCQTLRNWRDGFVNAYQESTTQTESDTEQRLRLLVQTEYYCSDNALAQRTEFVVTAFNTLNRQQDSNEISADTNARNQASTTNRDEVSRMNERVRRETEQQWRSLELELLRQRLENR